MSETTLEPTDAEVDCLLERFDQTEPKLQRKIVAAFVVKSETLQRKLDALQAERDGLVDGIKHANTELLNLWSELGEEGKEAEHAQSILHHLRGTITDDCGKAYKTELDTANDRIATFEAAAEEFRDCVLNSRHQLAETIEDSDQINAVLAVFDDTIGDAMDAGSVE